MAVSRNARMANGRRHPTPAAGRPAKRSPRRSIGFVTVAGVRLEVERHGRGLPLLLLPSEEVLEPAAPFVNELSRKFEVVIPLPPGFGRSARPDWITSVDDISYLYLQLIEKLGLDKVRLVGFSLGGWIAAEMASKDNSRLARIALVDPYGVKLGDATARDIADFWFLSPKEVAGLAWCGDRPATPDLSSLTDDELGTIARNRESFARLCWEPFMHNPQLKHRLGRIRVPTLLIWGENDGIVSPTYGRSYRRLIPSAQMAIIRKAGHYPHIEQPAAFMKRLSVFLQ